MFSRVTRQACFCDFRQGPICAGCREGETEGTCKVFVSVSVGFSQLACYSYNF